MFASPAARHPALPLLLALLLPLATGCDNPSSAAPATDSPASAAAPPPPPPTPSAAPPASTAAAAPAAPAGDTKNAMVIVRDPVKEPEKSVKVDAAGTLTLFLPDYTGTTWSMLDGDKALGKAAEEVAPGFAPGANGHQFKWSFGSRSVKAGQKFKLQFVNKKAGDKTAKPAGNFAMTIEIV